MSDFILDRPLIIEPHELFGEQSSDDIPFHPQERYPLANQDITFQADHQADLYDLNWPWADMLYARSVQIRLSAPREDEFSPIVARLYPGYIESIIGDEGLIVAKQLSAPLGSGYDRSALWLLACQAEGDRLLRVDILIDWGIPVEQRMVDGLLVAQVNPGPSQGIYEQQNADSTRVFGNPEGRPESFNLDDPQKAQLTYYVLINGEVEVQFLLTISDVGEQVAWNGFLALRDGAKVAEKSSKIWADSLQAGRLWTPDPHLNNWLNNNKIGAICSLQRLRTGMAPTHRQVEEAIHLIDAWDLVDPIQSRNLLAHLRRLAEKSNGAIPELFPLRRRDELMDPGIQVLKTNASYLAALERHMAHHFDAQLLTDHYRAIGLCAARLVSRKEMLFGTDNESGMATLRQMWQRGLKAAAQLARLRGDEDNATKWGETINQYQGQAHFSYPSKGFPETLRLIKEDPPAKPRRDSSLFGQILWDGLGFESYDESLQVIPQWPDEWQWWAIMDLPIDEDQSLCLVWDGETLHTTQPLQTSLPLQQHQQIKTLNIDEDYFALEFLFIDAELEENEMQKRFKPNLSG